MTNLGFVGLGLMGSRIVKRLLDAGYPGDQDFAILFKVLARMAGMSEA